MSDQPTNVNPYQAPRVVSDPLVVAEADWQNFSNQQIPFSVALTEQDIRRYYPSGIGGASVRMLACACIAYVLFNVVGISYASLIAIALGIGGISLVFRAQGWKTVINQSPRILQPISGYISPRGIYIESPGIRNSAQWEDIFSITTTSNCVVMRAESWRLASYIFPWDGFSDPAAARQAFKSVEAQKKTMTPIQIGDERLLQKPTEESLFSPPDNYVAFGGVVQFGEIEKSLPGRQLKRIVLRFLLLGIALFVGGIVVMAVIGMLGFLIAIPVMAVGYVMVANVYRHPLMKPNSEQAAFFVQGWLSEHKMMIHGSTGQQEREWNSFSNASCDDGMICLQMPGTAQSWYFLSKNQFVSEEEFQHGIDWANAGVAAKGSGSGLT